MTETSTLQAELENVREGLRTADLETARAEISTAGAGVIQRFEAGNTADSTDAEFVGATFSLLATEAVARLLTYAENGALDSPDASVEPWTPRSAASSSATLKALGASSKRRWTCSASRPQASPNASGEVSLAHCWRMYPRQADLTGGQAWLARMTMPFSSSNSRSGAR
jgi:hypothetical protein